MGLVEIGKSPLVVVKPSKPVMGTGDINLSSYDVFTGCNPVTLLWVFEHPIQEPVETIRRGLSQALVHYYPFAGRLAAGAGAGDVVIKSSMEGVSFVAASANCALRDVQDLAYLSLQEDLAVFYPAADGMCRFSDPLLLMQVTVFSCGGFVLGVTFNHAVADGVGICQFLQAVGELCRGLPSPSVVPVRQHDSIIKGPPPGFGEFSSALGSIQAYQMAVLPITVKHSLVDRIKDKYASTNSGRPCSVFDAVAAVLWRCRTRVIMSDPEALAVLVVTSDSRKYAGAKEGYYGNCVQGQVVTARAGAVANGDLMDLVDMIRGAKDRLPRPSQADVEQLAQLEELYKDLLVLTSVRNIGLEALDFGAGRPARVMVHSRG